MRASIKFNNGTPETNVSGVVDLDYEKNANAYVLCGEYTNGLAYKMLQPRESVESILLTETESENKSRLESEALRKQKKEDAIRTVATETINEHKFLFADGVLESDDLSDFISRLCGRVLTAIKNK